MVTGAGLILAGTFATLTLLPLEQLVQIGATVAIGVLLDTFVVRTLLIPAITYLCGRARLVAGPGRVSSVGGSGLCPTAAGITDSMTNSLKSTVARKVSRPGQSTPRSVPPPS